LKHADDQTVVGLVALLRAIGVSGLDPTGFGHWGIVAAPRYLGRPTFDTIFPRFLAEGAWGVSPYLIPHDSLHSPSGTFSQVLKAHGPNLGVGGAPGGEAEALLTAATWLREDQAPGVWVILTGWAPGLSPDDYTRTDACCEAIALAVVPSGAGSGRILLDIAPDLVSMSGQDAPRDDESPELDLLRAWFVTPSERDRAVRADRGHDPAARPLGGRAGEGREPAEADAERPA
jgi:hypothetical protein